ncbi:uncharacterized protein [Drosophila tropicalis]|uniref:uncharacterized protein n=1 Tax=Drosophila tropicalis TaxID=46794 RepID=UPI0035ABC5B0
MVPLRKATAAALEKAFRERILARFGNPRTLVSDNAESYRARKSNHQNHDCTIPGEWAKWLPEITLAINSSVNDTTGFSPAYIILGREPRMPGALYDQVTDVAGNEPPSPEERTRRMEDIFKLVHENQLNATQNQKKYYDLRRRDWRPNIGSMVMLKQHVLSNAIEGFNAKLAHKYKGPYKIIKFVSSNVVRLQETQGRE